MLIVEESSTFPRELVALFLSDNMTKVIKGRLPFCCSGPIWKATPAATQACLCFRMWHLSSLQTIIPTSLPGLTSTHSLFCLVSNLFFVLCDHSRLGLSLMKAKPLRQRWVGEAGLPGVALTHPP